MNTQLQNYIDQMRKRGFSNEQIREELKKRGWQDAQIDAELKTKQETTEPAEASSPAFAEQTLNKTSPTVNALKAAIIAGIFVLVSVAGVWAVLATQTRDPSWNPFKQTPDEIMDEVASLMVSTSVIEAEHEIEYSIFNMTREGAPYSLGDDETFFVKALDVLDRRESILREASYAEIMHTESLYSYSVPDKKQTQITAFELVKAGNNLYIKINEIGAKDNDGEWDKPRLPSPAYYFKLLEGKWIVVEEDNDIFPVDIENISFAGFLSNVFSNRDWHGDIEELPEETIDGRKTRHFKFDLSPHAFEQTGMKSFFEEHFGLSYWHGRETINLQNFFDKPIETEVWVDKKSKEVVRANFQRGYELSLEDFYDREIYLSVHATASSISYPPEPATAITAPSGPKTVMQAGVESLEEADTGRYRPFVDPNFEITLPLGWGGDAAYEPGDQHVWFYSPEDVFDSGQAAFLKIFLNPSFYTVTDINSEVDEFLSDIRVDPIASHEILHDQIHNFGEHSGRVVELTARESDRPAHAIIAVVQRDATFYYLLLTASSEHWHLHETDAMETILSFRPR